MSDQSPPLDGEIFLNYAPSNREKSQTAKSGLFWCSFCDSNKVGQHGKCSSCGRIENKKSKKLRGDVEYIEWIKPESTGLRIYLNKDAE